MKTLQMTITFAVPEARVFTHLTETASPLNWWGAKGKHITTHVLSLAAPNPWYATLVDPQGHGTMAVGEVRVVDPPHLVELTLSFAIKHGTRGPESVIIFTLATLSDGQTELTNHTIRTRPISLACVTRAETLPLSVTPRTSCHRIIIKGNPMPQYILTYHGGSQPETPEKHQDQMDRYMKWVENLDAVVPQQPLKGTQTLGDKEVTPMMGYTIINAVDLDAARAVAKSCPFLEMDNSAMQVSELVAILG